MRGVVQRRYSSINYSYVQESVPSVHHTRSLSMSHLTPRRAIVPSGLLRLPACGISEATLLACCEGAARQRNSRGDFSRCRCRPACLCNTACRCGKAPGPIRSLTLMPHNSPRPVTYTCEVSGSTADWHVPWVLDDHEQNIRCTQFLWEGPCLFRW